MHPNSSNNNLSFNEAYALNGKNPAIIDGANVYYAMQDMNSQICNMVANTGAITATQLVDNRDGNIYWVTKLKDGHCWMTQNLDFDIAANTTLNSTNTDLNVAYNSTTGNYPEYNDGYTVSNDIIYWTPANTATTIYF